MEKFIDTLDESVRPQDDFYQYANGKWLEETEVPEDKPRYGSFTLLRDLTREQVKNILEMDFEDEEFKNVSIFYESAMDSQRRNDEDHEPIQRLLDKINMMTNHNDLVHMLIDLAYNGSVNLFRFSSQVDRKNTEVEAPHLSSSGLSLPSRGWGSNRAYYFDEDKEEIRQEFINYLSTLFGFLRHEEQRASEFAQIVLEMEKQLAKEHYTQVEKRDPQLSYNRMEIDELEELVPNFPWKEYFAKFTTTEITYLIVDNPDFFKRFNELLAEEDINQWKIFLSGQVLIGAAPYLSERFEQANFNFYGKVISGTKEMEDRWKRVLNLLNGRFVLGELIGKAYVKEYFPPEAKEQMIELVDNLQSALRERLTNLSWMSDETKDKAMEKLDHFRVKIGYPDEFEDYTELNLDESNSYIENIQAATKFNRDISLERLYKAPDPNRWLMSPQTVNAYYNPTQNEIVFPAGILQYPFFDMNMTAAENYGGIGGVIGHEITHGFDDKGSQFGPKGNMQNWWSEADKEAFEGKTKYFVSEYEKFQIESSGKPLNGELTLGENIADHGGVRIAFHALQKHWEEHGKPEGEDGFTPEQMFFLSWARIWRTVATPEFEERIRMSDPHSPGKARVNVTLANVPEFHKYFEINEDDALYREELVELW